MNSERQAKVDIVKEISKKITSSKAIFIAEYKGLSVKDFQDLRKKLKPFDTEVKVYKNRLFKLANKKNKWDFSNVLSGANVYIFNSEDEIMPIKILVDFAKKHSSLKLKIGTYEGKIINKEEIYELSLLPSFEEALNILLNSMMGSLKMLSVSLNMMATNQQ